jgi:hypothetical protein
VSDSGAKKNRGNYSARFRPPHANKVVSREIDDVLAFLERFQMSPATEKEPTMEPSVRERLERFADGKSSDGEREEICEMLKAEPGLVRWVAEHVKNKRKR